MNRDRLTGLDASFLHLERGPAHMHVASTTIFEGPPPSYDEYREHIESRLHLVPRFRQKLRFVPLSQGRPLWVDDPQFNLTYHVRHSALPEPGGEEELRALAARVFSQRLDRSKPLWEMWLVDGLAGDRFAVVAKSHHCLVDGVSGVDISTVLFDASPEPAPTSEPATPWTPRPEPSDAELVADAWVERATTPAEIARGARRVFRGPRRAARGALDALEAAGAFARAGVGAPASPLNVEIGPYRRFATVSADLGEVKEVKNAVGGTVNDVVLSVVAGALGRYLRARGYSTQEDLRAMVPISVRGDDEHGALGNRVSSFLAPLPVGTTDPLARLSRVSATMGDLKQSKQAVGATLMTELTDFAPPTIAGQAARLQPRQRFFNLVVTNIPGPQFPLYLLGRRVEAVFPMVPLARRQALCFGILSYDGQLNFGIVGDFDAMPDLDSLGGDLETTLAETVAAAREAAGTRSTPRSAKASRSPRSTRV